MRTTPTLLCIVAVMTGCGPFRGVIGPAAPEERMSAAVTIARDEWGVPHIFGESDAAVAFGLGYAQAEDDLWQIEEDYLHALGRASHWYGERYLASDLVQAAFEVERLSREEYEREPPARRAVWAAFAAGLNHYIATSSVRPRLITSYEPWMPFALARAIASGTTIDGVRLGVMTAEHAAGFRLAGQWVDSSAADPAPASPTESYAVAAGGADMWAVAPSRSATGHAMLLHTARGDFTAGGRPYEMLLHSDAGWHVRGFAVNGAPVPSGGHTPHFAWSHATSAADAADVYEVRFDHPSDPLLYRLDGEWRAAVEWEDTLLVNSPEGVVERVFRFRRTHHGPVVAVRDGTTLAVRIARMEEGGSLQQLYAESRAGSLDEFRAALAQRALASNTMYADVEGSIYYVHGNAVPRRDAALDHTAPLDGSTSAAEWRDYHPLADLPQVLNPVSGWIVSTDGIFHAGTGQEGYVGVDSPRYLNAHRDASRGVAALRLVTRDSAWTMEELSAAGYDVHLHDTADAIARLIAEWEQVGGSDAARARRLDDAMEALRSWDCEADAGSEAALLFILWRERLRNGSYAGEHAHFGAMEDVLVRLEQDYGSVLVPLGMVNRLQRRERGEPFSDDDPGLPMYGAPGWAASVFSFDAVDVPESRRRYGNGGTRWIAAVELSPGVRFRSVVPFGQSGNPASAHWFDQAPLYAGGELKPGRFAREDIMASARRAYHPGEAVRELP